MAINQKLAVAFSKKNIMKILISLIDKTQDKYLSLLQQHQAPRFDVTALDI